MKTAIVYLPIKPEKAKEMNLPLKVPVLAKDLPKILDENTIPIDVLIRGLEAQFEISKDEYYLSYLLYFYYEKVKIFMNKGDYRAAQEHLRKAGALKKDYRYDFFSGILSTKTGDYDSAEIYLRSSVSKNPNFALAHYELGNLLYIQKDFQEAISEYKKSHDLDRDFLLPLLRIGDCCMEMGNLHDAKNFYKLVVEKDEDFFEAHARLGVLYNVLQSYRKAENHLKAALKINENDADTKLNLSHTLIRLGKHFEALEILNQLCKESDNPIYLNEYALQLRRLGFYEQAVEEIEKAKQKSDDPYISYNHALLTVFVDLDKGKQLLKRVPKQYSDKAKELLFFLERWRFDQIEAPDWLKETVEKIEPFLRPDVDLVGLAHLLESTPRIEQLRNGFFPMQDTNADTSKNLDIVLAILFASARDPIALEKSITKTSVALFGSGTMLAVSIALMRCFLLIVDEGIFNLEHFLWDVIPVIQDCDFEFARRLSKLEEESFSFEDLSFDFSGKGSELLLKLVQILMIDPSEEEIKNIDSREIRDFALAMTKAKRRC